MLNNWTLVAYLSFSCGLLWGFFLLCTLYWKVTSLFWVALVHVLLREVTSLFRVLFALLRPLLLYCHLFTISTVCICLYYDTDLRVLSPFRPSKAGPITTLHTFALVFLLVVHIILEGHFPVLGCLSPCVAAGGNFPVPSFICTAPSIAAILSPFHDINRLHLPLLWYWLKSTLPFYTQQSWANHNAANIRV